MTFTVVIPARYHSTRLEGKPLLPIAGRPMIEHVYQRASQSNANNIIVATDDRRIADIVRGFGGECEMTDSAHRSGTDRVAEVAARRGFDANHVVVNVQGDEPEIPAAAINQVAALLEDNPHADIATLCETVDTLQTLIDPNVVKVVRDIANRALYFSRAPLPWCRTWGELGDLLAADELPSKTDRLSGAVSEALQVSADRHIGIYAYRTRILPEFVAWPASALEQSESLEQLRALENGATILCADACASIPPGIDTIDDLREARARLEAS